MPKAGADGKPFVSKIASIQERGNFPAVENGLPAADIDLQPRVGFAKHTLVGLNVFLVQIAKQFNALLGIRTGDGNNYWHKYTVRPAKFICVPERTNCETRLEIA